MSSNARRKWQHLAESNRNIFYLFLLLGSALLLVSSCVITLGCEHKTEIEAPESGPLVTPFSEIIPSAEDIFFSTYRCHEETIYYPDGLVGYMRIFANESACGVDKIEDLPPPVVVDLFIYDYQNEEKATERILKEKKWKWYNDEDNEYFAALIELPPEDVACSIHFWTDPLRRKFKEKKRYSSK